MNFDYETDDRLAGLVEAQTADRRLRSYLIRALRDDLEVTDAAQRAHRCLLERLLLDVDRGLARRDLLIADLGKPPSGAATVEAA